MHRIVHIAVGAALALAGCNDSALGPGHADRNQPPDTYLTGGPPAFSTSTDYRVHLFWRGADHDGRIDHFDFILVDHPAAGSSADSLAAGHQPGRVPGPDDPRWTATAATDSEFVTTADSLPRPPQPQPGEDADFVRRQSFQRWHTFFVRAVDNRGAIDPTPEYRSFNASTLAPYVWLESPVFPGSEFQAPPTISFHWDGTDPLDVGLFKPPVASRWTLRPSRRTVTGDYVGFPDSLYAQPESAWSRWQSWDAPDGAGRGVIVRGLRPLEPESPAAGFYLFAVQAMDEAGAVTAVLDDRTPQRNNAVRINVTGLVGPVLTVSDRYLGTYTFIANSRPVAIDVAAGQPLEFHWRADGSAYGGRITGYRWGWDLRDPSDDEDWDRSWSETGLDAPPRSFNGGVHRMYVQVRDDAGTIVTAQFELSAQTITLARAVLWVDDSVHQEAGPEELEDLRWAAVLDSVAHRGGFSWSADRDVWDTGAAETRGVPVPLRLLFDYKAVVWSVVAPTRGSTLRDIAGWFDPTLAVNRNRIAKYNYLNAYVENGGSLWIQGALPSWELWRVRDGFGTLRLPVNVPQWDDPRAEHPDPDSVGLGSLLYKMGVEGFDVGSGALAALERADRPEHGALGFRRAAADLPGPVTLRADSRWPAPADVLLNPLRCRPGVEIYNMPPWIATRTPPLRPPGDLVRVLYVYSGGVPPPAASGYPAVADGQPAVLLRRTVPGGPFTRAYCGFEPWRLTFDSHLGLADAIIRRSFLVGGANPAVGVASRSEVAGGSR